jgi:hypothetical protein
MPWPESAEPCPSLVPSALWVSSPSSPAAPAESGWRSPAASGGGCGGGPHRPRSGKGRGERGQPDGGGPHDFLSTGGRHAGRRLPDGRRGPCASHAIPCSSLLRRLLPARTSSMLWMVDGFKGSGLLPITPSKVGSHNKLLRPLHRKRLHRPRHRQPFGLPYCQNRLHDPWRQQRHAQSPTDVGGLMFSASAISSMVL